MIDEDKTEHLTPFYFRGPEKPLFGCHHLPYAPSIEGSAVVLCYPLGHEYIRTHRACQKLAVLLAKAGFHTLRFDYYGCGDSGGDFEDGDFNQWQIDINDAIDEIKLKCGLNKVSLVGLRLGASLLMKAAAARSDVERMILWNPVLNGNACLDEWIDLHQNFEESINHTMPKRQKSEQLKVSEILGFPISNSLHEQLYQLELSSFQIASPKHLLLIENTENAKTDNFIKHQKNSSTDFEYRLEKSPSFWRQDPMEAIVPYQLLQSMVKWMRKE